MHDYNPEIETLFDITFILSRYASQMDAIDRLLYMLDEEMQGLQSTHSITLDTAYSLTEALRCIAGTVHRQALALSEKLMEKDTLPRKKEVA